MWGNVATSCATAFALLHRSAGVEERDQIRSDALAFFAVPGWPVHGLIDWHPATAASGRLTFRRRTCCLFRLIPGEMPCGLRADARGLRRLAAVEHHGR